MIQSLISLGIFAIASAVATIPNNAPMDCPLFESGDLFKGQRDSAVYAMNSAGQRAIFPNADIFFSWYADFSKVKMIDVKCLEKYPEGPAVLYRPGSRLLKSDTPDVYAVLPENKLAKIKNEEVASALYGNDWNKKVRILNDEQFGEYKKTDKIISEKTPHDGMFVKQHGILYYVDNGSLIEIDKNNNGKEHIETLILKDEDTLIMPILPPNENETAEKIYMKNLLNSSADRLLDEQKIAEQAFRNLRSVHSARQYSKIYFDNVLGDESKDLNDPVTDVLNSGRIIADSFIDKTSCDESKSSTELSFQTKIPLTHEYAGDYTEEGIVEIRSIEKNNDLTTYFQLRTWTIRDSESAFIYELLQDKWVRYNKTELNTDSQNFDPTIKNRIIAGLEGNAEPCNSSILFGGALEKENVLTVTKNFGNTELDGQQTFHYGFSMDKNTLTSLFSGWNGNFDKNLGLDSAGTLNELFEFVGDSQLIDAELWIGVEDQRPHKLILTMSPSENADEAEKKEIVYDMELSDFNDEFTVEAPTESTPISQIMEQILQKVFENLLDDPDPYQQSFDIETFDIMPVDETRDHIMMYPRIYPTARVTIVEYVDFECPFCKDFYSTMKDIVESYAYDVRWVIRQYPLTSMHERANYFANLTECAADQNKFWESIDVIYEFPRLDVSDYAKKLKISESQLSNCVAGKKHQKKINEDIEDGNRVGVTGVPHSVLVGPDGSMIELNGSVDSDTVSSAIDFLLTPVDSYQPY